jgi:hypothetical protein
MNTAFPVNTSRKIYRFSSEDTLEDDNLLLNALCRIEGIDGYYMKTQEPRMNGAMTIGGFHSEVGLCRKAFSRIAVASSVNKAPPKVSRKTRRPEPNEESNNSPLAKRRHFNTTSSPVRGSLFGGKRTRKRRGSRRRRTSKH